MTKAEERLIKYLTDHGFDIEGEYITSMRCNDRIGIKDSIKDKCIVCREDVWIGPNLQCKVKEGVKSICLRCLIGFAADDETEKRYMLKYI